MTASVIWNILSPFCPCHPLFGLRTLNRQPLKHKSLSDITNFVSDFRRFKFSERRAIALVCKLEKYMMQLVQMMHDFVKLTNRYEKRRIGKNN